jgi:hypothetical protein
MAQETLDVVEDIIKPAVRRVYQMFRVALPGITQSFSRETTRVAVAFGSRWLAMDRSVREEEPMQDLPVVMPRCGGYGIYGDMEPGDLGLVVACDGPVRGLYESGEPTTPQFPQMHDFGCGVVLPGGRVSSSESPTPPPNDAGCWHVGADDSSSAVVFRRAGGPSPSELGSMVLEVAGPTASLRLGSASAAVPPACEPQVQANLASLNTRIQAWVPVPNDGGASLKPIIAAWFAALQDMADAKARLDGPAGP